MASISRGSGLIRRQAVVEDKVRNSDGQMSLRVGVGHWH